MAMLTDYLSNNNNIPSWAQNYYNNTNSASGQPALPQYQATTETAKSSGMLGAAQKPNSVGSIFNNPSFGPAMESIGGGIGSLIGDLFDGNDDVSSAISQSGDIYQKYLQEALQEMQKEQAQGRQDVTGYLNPYTTAGTNALSQYQASLGMGGGKGYQGAVDQFQTSPGYQFAVNQGLDAIKRADAARGLTGSGAEAAALQSRGQQLANQEFGQWQQRLAGLAGQGQQAAEFTGGNLSNQDLGYGSDISQLYGTMGQAQANAQMAAAEEQEREDESMDSGLGDLAGAAGSLISLL